MVWVVKLGPKEGQVAGIARTSADVPRCHCTSTAEWITRQMFNVKAGLSRQPNTTHIRTHTYQLCKDTHTHTAQFITTLGRLAPQGVKPKPWHSPSMWLWLKITKQRLNSTYTKVFGEWLEKKQHILWCAWKHTQHTDCNVVLLKLAESHEMSLQYNVFSDSLFDLWLVPSENNTSILKDRR